MFSLTFFLLMTLVFPLSAQKTLQFPLQDWRGPELGDTTTVGPGERVWNINRSTFRFWTVVDVRFRGRTGANTFELEIRKTIKRPDQPGRPLISSSEEVRSYYLSPDEILTVLPEYTYLAVSFQVVDLQGSSLRFVISVRPESDNYWPR